MDVCKIENKTSTYHLGYVIGPRINAGEELENVLMGQNYCLITVQKKVFKLLMN